MKHCTTYEAYQLLHNGARALARVEAAGVRVDQPYLEEALVKTAKAITDMEKELQNDKEVYPTWKQAFGSKMNLASRIQLAKVIYDKLGYQAKGETKTKRQRTDKEALEFVDLPFVKQYVRLEEFKKARTTYLIGLQRELVSHNDGNWYVHPFFNLHTAISMRSSSNAPNWQNQPNRNPEIAETIRKCYIPRPNNYFGEPDFSMHEVRIPGAITGDSELRRYVIDKKSDIHGDQAQAIFCLKKAEVNKKTARQTTKNNFVFATFYGSAWYNCAIRVWEDIDRYAIKTVSGVPIREHLKDKGIEGLGFTLTKDQRGQLRPDADPSPGTFGHHVRQCQDKLWQRFKGYADWRQQGYERYHREGGLTMVTGFAFNGIGPKNEVMNYPIQGPAFHCLLWSLIRVVDHLLKYKMKTKVIGEIHDSMQLDIHPKEIQQVLDLCRQIMTVDLPKAWKWIDIPLETEVEISPLNKSWYFKKNWIRKTDGWQPE